MLESEILTLLLQKNWKPILTNQLKIWTPKIYPSSLLVPTMCVLLFLDIRSELQYQKQRSSNNFMILCLHANGRTSPFVWAWFSHTENFISKTRGIKPITNLFDENYLQMNYANLLQECQNIQLRISDAEIQMIERETLNQARESSFYQHRAGRIGASQSKEASHADPCQPSESLIKTICYPNVFKFSTAATRHGCKHGPLAIKEYEKQMKSEHENFQVKNCGTFINKEYPFLHATPNFLCGCDCCGLVCGEVKCPFCIDSLDFESYVLKKSSCLEKLSLISASHY